MSQKMKAQLRLTELLAAHVDPATGKPMSGRELSRRTGIRHRSVHYMMNGKAKQLPLDNIAAICNELGCTISDLIVLTPDDGTEEATDDVDTLENEETEPAVAGTR